MNKLIVLLLVVSTPAFADPSPVVSPWGSSPYVVGYEPPPIVDRAHRGLTLEVAFGDGTTSRDASTGAGTFAVGGWLNRDVALAFRVTEVGSFGFVGGSLQYYATKSLWLGGGIGGLAERQMDEFGGVTTLHGTGFFGRVGYQLIGHTHVLYVSGELQAGSIDGQLRDTAFVSVGYQLL